MRTVRLGFAVVALAFAGCRRGPDAGDGPWTIEFAVEVTPLEA